MIPTHDAEGLADRLELLFGDETLYNEMSEKCKKIYNERFTSEVNTRAIEKVYAELAGDKTGRND